MGSWKFQGIVLGGLVVSLVIYAYPINRLVQEKDGAPPDTNDTGSFEDDTTVYTANTAKAAERILGRDLNDSIDYKDELEGEMKELDIYLASTSKDTLNETLMEAENNLTNKANELNETTSNKDLYCRDHATAILDATNNEKAAESHLNETKKKFAAASQELVDIMTQLHPNNVTDYEDAMKKYIEAKQSTNREIREKSNEADSSFNIVSSSRGDQGDVAIAEEELSNATLAVEAARKVQNQSETQCPIYKNLTVKLGQEVGRLAVKAAEHKIRLFNVTNSEERLQDVKEILELLNLLIPVLKRKYARASSEHVRLRAIWEKKAQEARDWQKFKDRLPYIVLPTNFIISWLFWAVYRFVQAHKEECIGPRARKKRLIRARALAMYLRDPPVRIEGRDGETQSLLPSGRRPQGRMVLKCPRAGTVRGKYRGRGHGGPVSQGRKAMAAHLKTHVEDDALTATDRMKLRIAEVEFARQELKEKNERKRNLKKASSTRRKTKKRTRRQGEDNHADVVLDPKKAIPLPAPPSTPPQPATPTGREAKPPSSKAK